MYLIRQLHKWFGLVLGLQFLLWAASGAVMALLDHGKVAAVDAIRPVAHSTPPAAPATLAQVGDALGVSVLKLHLKPMMDGYVYEATTAQGVRLLRAADAAPLSVDAALARDIAVARYTGKDEVHSVEPVAEPTLETRDMALPAWRVEFADPDRTTLFVSAKNGDLLGAKNDTWRIWDFAWMLHIMDYDDRQSFNHPLIITVAMGGAWLALSGFILIFRSFRRSDFAWVLDPIEAVQARSKTGAQASSKKTM